MDIKEYKEKKSALESDIRDQVSSLVEAFKMDTNLSPHSIYIKTECWCTISAEKSQYHVTDAKVNIDL